MAQRLRAERDPDRNVGRTGSSPLLLAGRVSCGKCGASFQLETSGKLNAQGIRPYRYYNCRTATRIGKEHCGGSRISTEKLEQAVLEHIATEVFTESVCRQLIESLIEETGALREKTAMQRRSLRKELDQTEKSIARWQVAFETGQLPADLGIERLRELKARREELEETLAKVVPLKAPPYLYTEANIRRFQADLKNIFLSARTPMTKNYLRFLVEEIVITDDRVEISLKPRSALAMMSAEGRKKQNRSRLLTTPKKFSLQE